MNELIGPLIVIVLICMVIACVIALIVQFWFVSLPLAIAVTAGVIAYRQHKKQKEAEEEQRQAEEKVAERDRSMKAEYETSQRYVRATLDKCVRSSRREVEEIPKSIEAAEAALTEAGHEYAEGAFAPFWDAVESAANYLAQSDASINRIIEHSKEYRDQVSKLDSESPPFRIGIDTLPDTTRTTDRMRTIVRRAQKDFHFVTIYEQRKTNKLLIAGFTNLAEALIGMSERLELSIHALSSSLSDIARTDRANTEELIASVQKLHERMEIDSSAQREHEKKQREMLDNIQRGRRPRTVYPKTFE